MELKIFACDTLSGSVQHVASVLRAVDTADLDRNHIVLCEDRFSLSLERLLYCEEDAHFGAFNTEVYSFERLTNHLLRGKSLKYLKKSAAVMVMRKLLLDVKDELKCYRSLAESVNSGLAETVYDVIAQLKSCNVRAEELSVVEGDDALRAKAADIQLLYRKFDAFLEKGYVDAWGKLELLGELLDCDEIRASDVYLVGFDSLTPQGAAILGKIAKVARSLTVCISLGTQNDGSLLRACKQIAHDLGVKWNEERVLDALPPFATQIKNNLFSYRTQNATRLESESVNLFEAKTCEQEFHEVAKEIVREVKAGARYRDVVVASGLSEAAELAERVFPLYDIPFYVDRKMKLGEHPIVKLMVSALNAQRTNFSVRDVLAVVKNPAADFGDADVFENYCLRYAIDRSRFLKPFSIAEFEAAEEVRKKFAAFATAVIFPQVARVDAFCENFRTFLENGAFSARVDRLRVLSGETSEFAAFTEQVLPKTEEILSELDEFFGETVVTFDDFIILLASGLAACELSLIPLYTDVVMVTDFETARFAKRDVLFATTVCQGLVPFVKEDVGLLSDRDIDRLSEKNRVSIEPKIETINARERFNVLETLLTARRKLFVSFARRVDGKETVPSDVIRELRNLFSRGGKPIVVKTVGVEVSSEEFVLRNSLTESSASRVFAKLQSEGETALASSVFEALPKEKQKNLSAFVRVADARENVLRLLSRQILFSVSQFEKYFTCPFAFFVRYGLGATERIVAEVKSPDVGNYLHSALEQFMNRVSEADGIDGTRILGEQILAELKKDERIASFLEIPRFAAMIERLDHEAIRVCNVIANQAKFSKFKTVATELAFGPGEKMPAIRADGFQIRGKIDRVDLFEKYVRVVDYKSGRIEATLTNVYNGKKIQPYIYLDALCREGRVPAGALYFPVNDNFDEDASPYRMKGYVIKENEAIFAMDSRLEEKASSDSIPVQFKKDAEEYASREKRLQNRVVSERSSALSESEMRSVMAYAKEVSKGAVSDIRSGFIKPSPLKDACRFCEYVAICRKDAETVEARDPGTANIESIQNALGENDA